jgi:hypothetical protein
MIRDSVLKKFVNLDIESQISEFHAYKKLGDYSPLDNADYFVMESVINNSNIDGITNYENTLYEGNIDIETFKKSIQVIHDDIETLIKSDTDFKKYVTPLKAKAQEFIDKISKNEDVSDLKNFLLVSNGTVSIRSGENTKGNNKQSEEFKNSKEYKANSEAKMKDGFKFKDFKNSGDFKKIIEPFIGDSEKLKKIDTKILQAYIFKIIFDDVNKNHLVSLDTNKTTTNEFFQSLGFACEYKNLNYEIIKDKKQYFDVSLPDDKVELESYISKNHEAIERMMMASERAKKEYHLGEHMPQIHFIHKNIKDYYTALASLEKEGIKSAGGKNNTADVILSSVPGDELIKVLNQETKPTIHTTNGSPVIKINDINFVQVSLKVDKKSQYGKVTSYLLSKLGGDDLNLNSILNDLLKESGESTFYSMDEGMLDSFSKGVKSIWNKSKEMLDLLGSSIKKVFFKIENFITQFLSDQERERNNIYRELLDGAGLKEELSIYESEKPSVKFFQIFKDDDDRKIKIIEKARAAIIDEMKILKNIKSQEKYKDVIDIRFDHNAADMISISESNDSDIIIKLVSNLMGLRLINKLINNMDQTDSEKLKTSFVDFFSDLDVQSKTGSTNLPILKVYGDDKPSELIQIKTIDKKSDTPQEKLTDTETKKDLKTKKPLIIVLNTIGGGDKSYFALSLLYISPPDNLQDVAKENKKICYMKMQLRTNRSGVFTFTAENSKKICDE